MIEDFADGDGNEARPSLSARSFRDKKSRLADRTPSAVVLLGRIFAHRKPIRMTSETLKTSDQSASKEDNPVCE